MSKVLIAATGQSNWAQEKSFGDMCIDYCSFGLCGQIAVNSEKKCKKVEYFMLFFFILRDKSICKPLSIIFKSCLTQGIFLSDWKKANLPIHKKATSSVLQTTDLSPFPQSVAKF